VQEAETEGRGAGGGFHALCRVLPCFRRMGNRLAMFGMAVVSGRWALEGEVGGRVHIFSSALPVDRPFKPSISPTPSTRSAGYEISSFATTPTSYLIYFEFFRHGYCRFELRPILAAPFKPNILQTSCFTAHAQEWQIWLDNQLTRPASVTTQQSRRNARAGQAARVCRCTGSAPGA
jgi:hypothetical protein